MAGTCHCHVILIGTNKGLGKEVSSYSFEDPVRDFFSSALIEVFIWPSMDLSESESIRAASAEISREFKTLVNSQDIDNLKHLQNLILGRLQDSNAILSHFNEYSEHCFADVSNDFSVNTRLLRSMKSDLDYIFQKLRDMKAKISDAYPEAFPGIVTSEVSEERPDLDMQQ